MSTQTLSHVTKQTMSNVRTAATQVVAASGAGSRRLVQAVDGTVQRQVLPVTHRLSERTSQRLDSVRGNVSRIALQGIDSAVARSEQLIGVSSDFMVAQVERWADITAGIGNTTLVQGLDAAARLSLPAAQLAQVVTGKIAEGATSLADVAGAHPVAAVARKAGKAAKTTQRRVRKAVEAAPVKKTVRRASRRSAA